MRLPLVLPLLLIAGCGGTTPALQGGVVQVVAIESTWGDIARQIGGSRVDVRTVLTDPGTDPHAFETDPKTAALVGSAGFVITNGLGYDAFADKLLSASGSSSRSVLTIAAAVGADAGANPHLWYSPTYVQKGAAAIAASLTRLDRKDAASFAEGLRAFLASYQSYVDVVAGIRAEYAGKQVAYTEPVPSYLVEAAGLTLGTPESFSRAVGNGNDPSPADVDAFSTALRSGSVKALLYNNQVTRPVTSQVKALAEDAGTPVVVMTELPPKAAVSFQAWQTGQAQALLAALR